MTSLSEVQQCTKPTAQAAVRSSASEHASHKGAGPEADLERFQAGASCDFAGHPQVSQSLGCEEIILMKIDANMLNIAAGRRPLVLLCNGAFNPIHRQHTRIFYLAREVSFLR